MSFAALFPAFIHSVEVNDRKQRLYRVRIPGLTDGAAVQPRAKVMQSLGDKSDDTEIRILPGDPVWLAFERGDTRAPIIVGYRTRHDDANVVGWRRWAHDNIQFTADDQFLVLAANVTIKATGNITASAQGDVSVSASGTANVSANGAASVRSDAEVTVTAPAIKLNGA